MKNLTIGAILIVFCFVFSGIAYQTTNNHKTIQESSHFKKWIQHNEMKNYSWFIVESPDNKKWKTRNRKLIRKDQSW